MFDDNCAPYKITLDPSKHVEAGSYPQDKGSTVVQIEITFSNPWPANYTLEVYAVTPEIMTYDNTGNVTVYKWPTIPLNANNASGTINVN